MIAAVLTDVVALSRSWSLGIFTAAMAPQKQWLSQKMVQAEEEFRTSLGSSGLAVDRMQWLTGRTAFVGEYIKTCKGKGTADTNATSMF